MRVRNDAIVINFDEIVNEWLEKANSLMGPSRGLGIASPAMEPYLEPSAKKQVEVLSFAMKTILYNLKDEKSKNSFKDWCAGNTRVEIGGNKLRLTELECFSELLSE